MVANALFAAGIIFMAIGLYVMQECRFLIPYRRLLWEKYSGPVALYGGLLFINLFALLYALCRKLFLKDTGRKLAHLEKQLRTGGSISEELLSASRSNHGPRLDPRYSSFAGTTAGPQTRETTAATAAATAV